MFLGRHILLGKLITESPGHLLTSLGFTLVPIYTTSIMNILAPSWAIRMGKIDMDARFGDGFKAIRTIGRLMGKHVRARIERRDEAARLIQVYVHWQFLVCRSCAVDAGTTYCDHCRMMDENERRIYDELDRYPTHCQGKVTSDCSRCFCDYCN